MNLSKQYILEGKAIQKNSTIQLIEKQHKYDYVYLDMNQLLTVEQNEEFHDFQSKLDSNLIYTEENDYGIERNHHITAYYGLLYNNENLNKIKHIIDITKNFTGASLYVEKIDFFRNDDVPYDVMKFKVNSNFLLALHNCIDSFPNENTHKEYQAHMTIAYIKKGAFSELEGYNNFSFCNVEIPIKEVVFQDVYDSKTVITI